MKMINVIDNLHDLNIALDFGVYGETFYVSHDIKLYIDNMWECIAKQQIELKHLSFVEVEDEKNI